MTPPRNMTSEEFLAYKKKWNDIAKAKYRALHPKGNSRVHWTNKLMDCHKRVSVIWPGCAYPDKVSITQFKSWGSLPAGTVVLLDGVVWDAPYKMPKKKHCIQP